MKGKMLEVIPMHRVAQPEEMAEAVIWLCRIFPLLPAISCLSTAG